MLCIINLLSNKRDTVSHDPLHVEFNSTLCYSSLSKIQTNPKNDYFSSTFDFFSLFNMHSASQALAGLLLVKWITHWLDQDVSSLNGWCGWYCCCATICHCGHRHQWELNKGSKARIIHVWLPHFIPSGPQMHRPIHGSQKNRSENKIGMKEEIK